MKSGSIHMYVRHFLKLPKDRILKSRALWEKGWRAGRSHSIALSSALAFCCIVAPTIAGENPDRPPCPSPDSTRSHARETLATFASIPDRVTVRQFCFEGNTAIADEVLREAVAAYRDRPLSFAELLEVEAIVTELYVKEGYINSGAVLAAGRAIENGTVWIQIVEGSVEVNVAEPRRFPHNYLRERIERAARPPFDRDRLLEELQFLQLDPLIENISAEVSAGTRPDRAFLDVAIEEARSFDAELFLDNGRAPSVGSIRRGLLLRENNLLGRRDRVSLAYTNTDGSNSVDFDYFLPIDSHNTSLGFAAGFTNTSVVEEPFDRIDINGDSRYFELSLQRPIVQKPTQEFTLGIAASRRESETFILEEGFPLAAGADDEGRTRISSLRFFQDYSERGDRYALGLRSQFSVGLGIFDATINSSDSPDSRFFAWRGQGQYVRQLARETLFVARSDIQLASEALVPLEQFGLGGLRSVRGYRQDSLLTDSGFFTSAEVRIPVLRAARIDGLLQIVPFIDVGVGWNVSGNADPDPNTLIGLGMGLLWRMGNGLSARFDVGFPLTDVDSTDRTLQEDGIYFSLQYNPLRRSNNRRRKKRDE